VEEPFSGLGFNAFDNRPEGDILHKRRLFVHSLLHT
jgi:hypothetical protein